MKSEMSTQEFIDWAKGHILVSIGKGKFDEAVSTVIMSAMKVGGDNAMRAINVNKEDLKLIANIPNIKSVSQRQ